MVYKVLSSFYTFFDHYVRDVHTFTVITQTSFCESRYYSSINFVLLGYVLVGLNAVDSWDAYDQSSVIPAAFRSDYAGGWSFPNHGRCSAHPGVAHQYAGAFTGAADIASLIAPNDVGQLDIFDLYNFSCANGWTMGNVASSGLNLAMFFRDV